MGKDSPRSCGLESLMWLPLVFNPPTPETEGMSEEMRFDSVTEQPRKGDGVLPIRSNPPPTPALTFLSIENLPKGDSPSLHRDLTLPRSQPSTKLPLDLCPPDSGHWTQEATEVCSSCQIYTGIKNSVQNKDTHCFTDDFYMVYRLK